MGSGSEAVHKWIQGAWVHNVMTASSGKQPAWRDDCALLLGI